MPTVIEERLRPSGPVRMVLFWTPLVLVLRQLSTSSQFRNLHAVKKALLGFMAAFSTLWTTAYFTASWQLKPLPSDKEIEELGGRRFIRPSDGKVMEYWLSGDVGSKTAVVFCHRMDGKCGVMYGRTKVEAMLKTKGAVLVSPSIPSLSASPPYETVSATQWLKQWTEDMMFLLKELDVEHVYVLGLSWGAQLCLNLAMACQTRGMLRGIAPIGGNYWDTRRVQYKYGPDVPEWSKIFAKPAVIKPLAYLMMRPFIPKMGDVSMMPEKEIECLKKHFGEDLTPFGTSMVRGMSYFLHQNWHVGILVFASRDADEYVEISKFDPSIPIHLYLGEDDNMVGPQQQPFLDQVKHAELKKFKGSHAGFPLDEIIVSIMDAKSK
jgi:pimeloyl-ACP methyl ester carboxylesterase